MCMAQVNYSVVSPAIPDGWIAGSRPDLLNRWLGVPTNGSGPPTRSAASIEEASIHSGIEIPDHDDFPAVPDRELGISNPVSPPPRSVLISTQFVSGGMDQVSSLLGTLMKRMDRVRDQPVCDRESREWRCGEVTC